VACRFFPAIDYHAVGPKEHSNEENIRV
jgi:hypothetical protein